MLRLETATHTDIGLRATNQDCLFAKIENIAGKVYGLFCVSDGMGGLNDGHYAATVAIESVEKWWNKRLRFLIEHEAVKKSHINEEFTALFRSANDTILQHSQKENAMIGTTCSLLFVCNNMFYIAHTGDTRIYMTQKQWFLKSQIKQLTDDHSWEADQFRKGLLSADEIQSHPNKNKLTGCLGVFEHPRVFTYSDYIKRDGFFILCSDGLYRAISDSEMEKIASRQRSCEHLAKKLIVTAKERNTPDNASVVVVKFGGKIKRLWRETEERDRHHRNTPTET